MPINTSDVEAVIREHLDTTLVRPLEETSKFLSLGARVIPSAAPVSIPKLVASYEVNRVGESELIPTEETADVFDDLKLMPSTMKSYKSIIRISNESLRSSAVALDSVLSTRLVRDFQTAIDKDGFSSTGDGVASARGVFAAHWGIPNISVAEGAEAQPLTYDVLFDAIGQLEGADAPTSGLKWLLDPATLTGLRKIKDGNGRYILDESVTSAPGGGTLLGIPVVLTKRLEPASATSKRAMLINPSSWVVVRDTDPTIKVLTERYAEYDEIGIRITARYDWGTVEPSANVILTGIK